MILKPDSPLIHALHPSPNTEDRRKGCRADMIVLHYTGMSSADKAIRWLANPKSKVSCHYVIDEAGSLTQMVAETQRAWHAGASHWAGETDINSVSIGIEVQNPGHEHGYPEYPAEQMQAVAALCRDIAKRRGVAPQRVLALSDVAPGRKIDPGEKFPWKALFAAGVGQLVPAAPIRRGPVLKGADTGAEVEALQSMLALYGYGVEISGVFDRQTEIVVEAFQRHFRPRLVDGIADGSTIRTLQSLLTSLRSVASK